MPKGLLQRNSLDRECSCLLSDFFIFEMGHQRLSNPRTFFFLQKILRQQSELKSAAEHMSGVASFSTTLHMETRLFVYSAEGKSKADCSSRRTQRILSGRSTSLTSTACTRDPPWSTSCSSTILQKSPIAYRSHWIHRVFENSSTYFHLLRKLHTVGLSKGIYDLILLFYVSLLWPCPDLHLHTPSTGSCFAGQQPSSRSVWYLFKSISFHRLSHITSGDNTSQFENKAVGAPPEWFTLATKFLFLSSLTISALEGVGQTNHACNFVREAGENCW